MKNVFKIKMAQGARNLRNAKKKPHEFYQNILEGTKKSHSINKVILMMIKRI